MLLPEGWAAAIEASPIATAVKTGYLVYPLVNTAHVLGMALIVGAMAALDLRILGLARDIPLRAAERYLRALAICGLMIAIPSGAALFAADAVTMDRSTIFALKLGLIALALANAALFAALWRGRIATWDSQPAIFGRIQAALSLTLWIGVATSGRLIAYL